MYFRLVISTTIRTWQVEIYYYYERILLECCVTHKLREHKNNDNRDV